MSYVVRADRKGVLLRKNKYGGIYSPGLRVFRSRQKADEVATERTAETGDPHVVADYEKWVGQMAVSNDKERRQKNKIRRRANFHTIAVNRTYVPLPSRHEETAEILSDNTQLDVTCSVECSHAIMHGANIVGYVLIQHGKLFEIDDYELSSMFEECFNLMTVPSPSAN